MAAVVIPLSRFAPKIAGRVGVRVTGPIGLGLMATGLVILSTLDGGSSYWHFLVGIIPFGAGAALAGAPATTAIVASLPREKQGVASAINDVSRELGGAMGIAILGSILNSAYRSGVAEQTSALPPGLADQARGSLAAAQAIGNRLGAENLVTKANEAFVHGFSVALLSGAALLIAGGVFVAIRAPGRVESEENAGRDTVPSLSPHPTRDAGMPASPP
jgi:hypothetical protein